MRKLYAKSDAFSRYKLRDEVILDSLANGYEKNTSAKKDLPAARKEANAAWKTTMKIQSRLLSLERKEAAAKTEATNLGGPGPSGTS